MNKLMTILLTILAIVTPTLDQKTYLPMVVSSENEPAATVCSHPRYDELELSEGQAVCYDRGKVEEAYGFVGRSGGVLVVSVVQLHDGSPWYAPVYINYSADFGEIYPGLLVSFTGEVHGTCSLTGQTPEDSLSIPMLLASDITILD